MTNPLFLFVGRSASGKTTIANMLEEQYGYKQVQSYTTRPKRYEGETGHIFISKEDFDKLEDIVAYVKYDGNEYCATSKQLDECDIYVIDPIGVETLFKNYKNAQRPICIIYFDAAIKTRIDRMINRCDSDMEIVSRLYHDEEYDWFEKLHSAVSKASRQNIKLFKVNSNVDKQDVFNNVVSCIIKRYVSEAQD